MNPVDHPHGGGEGKTSGGRNPVTPWGQPTRGYKTRRNKRTSNMIVKDQEKSKCFMKFVHEISRLHDSENSFQILRSEI